MFENYRPISILPAISKMLEKTIFNKLHDYFQDNKLYCKNQYGFRRNHSTEYAALELIDRVILDMDKNEITVSIFIDLSKAFDPVDHNIVINKLQYYGIKGPALDIFQSYLSNRRQFVQIGNNNCMCATGINTWTATLPYIQKRYHKIQYPFSHYNISRRHHISR